MQKLNCHVKQYAWGKVGNDSEVCRLYAAGHSGFTAKHEQPYAELWMGTHPDGPAQLATSGTKLSTLMACRQSGLDLAAMNDDANMAELHLPFIMKVMSIRTTLSLQVHPTKEQAAGLNAFDPVNYPDCNHKPELALALTTFQLLCGFRPAKEIASNLSLSREFRSIFGEQNARNFENMVNSGIDQDSIAARKCLAAGFRHMMHLTQRTAEQKVHALLKDIHNDAKWLPEHTVALIEKLQSEFPGDIGCFSPLYLNHIVLQPGQCCYYGPQELHAYLSGECIECVANSNNTIRAALTPKHKDMEILCETLNYRMTDPSYYILPPVALNEYPNVKMFGAKECPDFKLHQIKIDGYGSEAHLPRLWCDSILVVISGTALVIAEPDNKGDPHEISSNALISRGDIFHISPGTDILLEQQCNDNNEFVAYRTFSYADGPAHAQRNINMPSDVKSQKDIEAMLKLATKMKMTTSTCNDLFDLACEMDGFC